MARVFFIQFPFLNLKEQRICRKNLKLSFARLCRFSDFSREDFCAQLFLRKELGEMHSNYFKYFVDHYIPL